MTWLRGINIWWLGLAVRAWQWSRSGVLLCLCLGHLGCAFATLDTVVQQNFLASPEGLQNVQVLRQGTRLPTTLSMSLQQGDEIITDAESTVWISFASGDDVIVGPNSHVQIRTIYCLLFCKVYARVRGLFRVETEYVVAGTEGTEFLTTVDRDNTVSIVVVAGAIQLTSKTQRWAPTTVRQAERATMRGQESPQRQPVTPQELDEIRLWASNIEQLIPPPERIELPFRPGPILRPRPRPDRPPRQDDTGQPPTPPSPPPAPYPTPPLR